MTSERLAPDVGAGLGEVTIGPIHAPKASEIFAKLLREKILAGEFAEGEPLPSERALVEKSHLSRASVREAIGILKQQGLVTTRPGRNGGSIVTRPSSQGLVTSLETYVQAQGWGRDSRTILEMREITEPWCAAFAASRRTDRDLERIQAEHQRGIAAVDDIHEYVRAGQGWHTAVADASHNELLAALMRARSDAVLSVADRKRYDSREARTATLELHEQITGAIVDRDPAAAFALMQGHVRGSAVPLLQSLVDETGRP